MAKTTPENNFVYLLRMYVFDLFVSAAAWYKNVLKKIALKGFENIIAQISIVFKNSVSFTFNVWITNFGHTGLFLDICFTIGVYSFKSGCRKKFLAFNYTYLEIVVYFRKSYTNCIRTCAVRSFLIRAIL